MNDPILLAVGDTFTLPIGANVKNDDVLTVHVPEGVNPRALVPYANVRTADLTGRFTVRAVGFAGGDPREGYPAGWMVRAARDDGMRIQFYQTGLFQNLTETVENLVRA